MNEVFVREVLAMSIHLIKNVKYKIGWKSIVVPLLQQGVNIAAWDVSHGVPVLPSRVIEKVWEWPAELSLERSALVESLLIQGDVGGNKDFERL
jgi:hypothetical protein